MKKTRSTHLNSKGQFQSDKFPSLPPDFVAFKITKITAGRLRELALLYWEKDPEFAQDLHKRCEDGWIRPWGIES